MKNQKETIRKMVSYLNDEEWNGGFWLPNIQRPFVWREDQIERLFDSIMREYPISTLLVWRTKSRIRRRKFIDNYKNTIRLTDFYVPEDDKTKLLVLDGQQRLQSLFIGLKGSYEKRELYFDVLSGDLVAPEDIRYKFKFLDAEKAAFPWVKFKEIVFINELSTKIAKSIIRNAGRELTESEKERVEENIALVQMQFVNRDLIVYQELDSVDNTDAYREDDVVEIFIRANSGGTRLGKSDLLFSLLTSSWEDADERMDELLDDINRVGYDFTRDFILKTCLTLLNKGAAYEVKKFRDERIRQELIDKWEGISAAIRDVRDYLYGRTFIRTDKAMPSYLVLIPIIYFRYHFPQKWGAVQNLDDYLLRTLLSGAFSGTPDNMIDRCVKAISSSGEFDVNEIFGIVREDGRSLELAESTILGQYYGSKQSHLIFNLWYRDFNYIPAYENNLPQADHIFPQSLLRKVKKVNPRTGRQDLLRYYQEDRDQIANLMLLTAEENGFSGKRDIPPNEWFAEKDEAYLEMHLIPKNPDLWELDNYEAFIEERKRLILDKFSHIIQGA
ncbi:GmrSD restriction endonuclease domain-containing protein [Methanoculleus horonobensis]|uniref:GmrSD restriction endonuclease domain-containing protein n=1 Tax=Methanoculleus horonobensis TaxID=528314 RepID=UPI00082A8D23|nr:DUF262 domain-containing protein [Methanoculleus horonobensis]